MCEECFERYGGCVRLPVPGPRDLLHVLERGADSVEQLLAAAPRMLAVVGRAAELVGRVDAVTRRIEPLLDGLEPPLTRLQPVLERLAETTDPHEVDALVQLVDHLPRLADRMESDVLPMLDSLNTVAPDLHELLNVSRELNEMLSQIPGLSRMRKFLGREPDEEGRSEAARPTPLRSEISRAALPRG